MSVRGAPSRLSHAAARFRLLPSYDSLSHPTTHRLGVKPDQITPRRDALGRHQKVQRVHLLRHVGHAVGLERIVQRALNHRRRESAHAFRRYAAVSAREMATASSACASSVAFFPMDFSEANWA